MPSITTGGQNIAIGDNAMFSNETGAINVAIGAGAFENAKKEMVILVLAYGRSGLMIAVIIILP